MRDSDNHNKGLNGNQEGRQPGPPSSNENNTKNVIALLGAAGIGLSDAMGAQLNAYLCLVRDWNPFASLVSPKDLDLLEQTHVPDSLSLAPVVRRLGENLRLLDIGSGGGFPALPLKIVLPDLRVELVERNAKKAGFLEKAIGSLHLSNVRVVQGDFPQVDIATPDVVTARAVEKPGRLLPLVLDVLPVGGVFLCQTGRPDLDDRFHVERVEDEWAAQGLRRGDLYLVRRLLD